MFGCSLPGKVYFHLDEVKSMRKTSGPNIALHQPATQSSVSQWSRARTAGSAGRSTGRIVKQSIERGEQLAAALRSAAVPVPMNSAL